MSERVDIKARCYLRDGAAVVVEVRPGLLVRAEVTGSAPAPYAVTWTAQGGWRCNCATRTVRCSHVTAVATITDVQGVRTATAVTR
jgi:uncharacterized Zn finger protein